jgi:hypothetical protein
MKDIIHAGTLAETKEKISCDCGYRISVLPPDKTWRKVLCICGILWWVKPSGRRFEKHKAMEDMDYGR